MAIIARENSSLRRRSGVRNAAANACSTCPPLVSRVSVRTTLPPTTRRLAAGPCRAAVEPASGEGQESFLYAGRAAPGRGDLLGSGGGECVRVHLDGHPAEVAGAEHLDR